MKCPNCGCNEITEFVDLYPNGYVCTECGIGGDRSYFERIDVRYQGNVVVVEYIENRIAYKKKYSQKEFADLGTSENIIKDLKMKHKGLI